MKARIFFALFGLIIMNIVSAQKVELKLNLAKGDTFTQTLQSTQNIEIQGVNIPQTMTFVIKNEVLDKDSDNNYDIKFTYHSIKMVQENPLLGKMAYDSDKPDSSSEVLNFWNSFLNKYLVVKISPAGECLKITNTNIEQIPVKVLEENLQNYYTVLPQKAVGINDSWTNVQNIKNQDITCNNLYKIKEITKGEVLVEVTSKMLNADSTDAGMQTGLIKYDLKTGLNKETVLTQDIKAKPNGMAMNIKGETKLITKKD